MSDVANRSIGQSIPRKENWSLLTGAARFLDDLEPVAGLRAAAILRSPYGHAEILGIDTTKAEALPGVIGILTGRHVEALSNPIRSIIRWSGKYYPCALDRVRYFGEPVAVVVAENRYIAEDALDLIEVKYRPLPVVVDLKDAISDGAFAIHDGPSGNIVHRRTFRYGDPETAFATADHIETICAEFPRISSTPIETYGVVAHFEQAPDRYTVWSNFQGPYALHPVMSGALRIPSQRLRLISAPASGGSFGIKQGVFAYIVLIAVTSRYFGVPVKWIEDRQEHLTASSSATSRLTTIEGAFTRDGELTGVRLKQVENIGAYVRPPEPSSLYRMQATLSGPYRVRNLAVENLVAVTNQMPSGLNRGFGGPQFFFPLERLMSAAAAKLKLDPTELRRRNLVRKDEFPYETPAGSVLDSGDYLAALELALERAGYDDLLSQQKAARANGRLYGLGVAVAVETSGSNMAYVALALTPEERARSAAKSGGIAEATVTMDPLGSIVVRIDSLPSGQGHETVAAQVVADELGVSPDDVDVETQFDTRTNAWSIASGNYSSRFAPAVCSAVALASRQVARKLRVIAANAIGVEPYQVTLANGVATGPQADGRSVPIKTLAGLAHWHTAGLPQGETPGINESAVFSDPSFRPPDASDRIRSSLAYGFLCDVCAIEIDKETGQLEIKKYVHVHDVGNVLNPSLLDGQTYGSFAHGIGAALSERIKYGADGTMMTSTFADYLCPTAADIPELVIDRVSTPSPNTILGAKGGADGAIHTAPAAIANAVSDALGILDVSLPLTPGRVWELMHGRDPDGIAVALETGYPADDPLPALTTAGSLKGQGEVVLHADAETVWTALFDAQGLREIIPGCRSIEQTAPDEFHAEIKVSVAGIGGVYKAILRIEDKQFPLCARLLGRGEGRLGFGEGEAAISLVKIRSGETKLRYQYVANVGGTIAGVGSRLLEGVMQYLVGEFFHGLDRHLSPKTAKASSWLGRIMQRLAAAFGVGRKQ